VDPTVFTLQSVFRMAAPEALLVVAACVVFVGGAFRPNKTVWGLVSLAGFIVPALAVVWYPADLNSLRSKISPLWPDELAFYTRIVAIVGGVVLLLMTWDELPDEQAPDYFACLLVLSAGTALVGSADELITMFLALEMISIPTYIMLYLPRTGRPVQEAAVKYFLLSIFSSALLLFGFSYLYGVTGTTNVAAIHEAMARADAPQLPALLLAATVMVVAGLGFRITAVPFHFYAPDVYEGSANGPAALLAFIPKVAGFVALIRLLGFCGPGPILHSVDMGTRLPLLLWILAAITMTVGNVVAVWQTDVKRLLAYSGIAHSGYMLMGLATAPYLDENSTGGVPAVLFYLLAYGAMTVGAFAVLQAVSTSERPVSQIDELAGLSGTHPILALTFALFLFSLIGLPLTAGFTGKFLLFMGALTAQGHTQDRLFLWLAIIGAVNAAIGAYYYLRIVAAMYLRTAIKPLAGHPGLSGILALAACAGVTIWLGCYPPQAMEFARKSAEPVYALDPVRAER
jgi:NADH-quinone oxidoreductase subunit N